MAEDARFCPNCGASVQSGAGKKMDDFANQAQEAFDRFNNTEDTTNAYTQQQIADGKVMGILSYIGFLVLVPLLADKNNPFVRYHANQGLVLFLGEIIYAVVRSILVRVFWIISFWLGMMMNILLSILSLIFIAYMIIGIVNVCNGKARELPLIGKIRLVK